MNGILVVDKPQAFTSFDVVAKLRGILKERKIGHGGTLDPMATGVLPVFVGTATKAIDLLPCTDKRYIATIQLGLETDTGDITGAVVARGGQRCDRTALEQAIPHFVGDIAQIPPMYSAVQVNGKRLYQLAREGKTIERQPRAVTVYSIVLLNFEPETQQFVLDIRCSKGTYIRTLAEDLAHYMGGFGCLAALRRTMSAGFLANESHTIDAIAFHMQTNTIGEILSPVDRLFQSYPRLELDSRLTRLFLNGVAFDTAGLGRQTDEKTAVTVYGGQNFLGIGRVEDGKLIKVKQFYIPAASEF